MMSRDAEALLAKGRASPPRPTGASRARMRERVLLQVGAAAVAGASGAAAAKASPALASSVTKLSLAWKVLGALLLSGGLVGGALALRDPSPTNADAAGVRVVDAQATSPHVAPPPPPPAVAAPPIETSDPAAPAPATSEPPPAAVGAKSAPPQRPASDADALAEEAALLKEAQAALGAGNGAKALALANEHAARYPSGALSSERRLIRALALCATGSKARGASEGRAAFPDESSASRKRIEAACQ